jgi:hypothetical protein
MQYRHTLHFLESFIAGTQELQVREHLEGAQLDPVCAGATCKCPPARARRPEETRKGSVDGRRNAHGSCALCCNQPITAITAPL